MDFQKRSEAFQQEIEQLQKKYGVVLYAAQVLLQNGELILIIKMRDVDPSKTYDNNPQAGDPASAKAQKNSAKG